MRVKISALALVVVLGPIAGWVSLKAILREPPEPWSVGFVTVGVTHPVPARLEINYSELMEPDLLVLTWRTGHVKDGPVGWRVEVVTPSAAASHVSCVGDVTVRPTPTGFAYSGTTREFDSATQCRIRAPHLLRTQTRRARNVALIRVLALRGGVPLPLPGDEPGPGEFSGRDGRRWFRPAPLLIGAEAGRKHGYTVESASPSTNVVRGDSVRWSARDELDTPRLTLRSRDGENEVAAALVAMGVVGSVIVACAQELLAMGWRRLTRVPCRAHCSWSG